MSNLIKNDISRDSLNKNKESPKKQNEHFNFKDNSKNFDFTNYDSSKILKANNSSINILNRNILSINNSKFDNLKKVKSLSTIYQIDKNENNYLNPLSNYSFKQNEMKEEQKRNNINSLEWLSIIKHKLFSIDINSKVKKGKNISRNQFYEEKNRTIISPSKILKNNNVENNKVITSYQFINKNNTINNNYGYDYKFNSGRSMDNIFNCKRFKINSEVLNKKKMNIKEFLNQKENIDYWKKMRLNQNKSLDISSDENINENSPDKLKSNYLYFERHKNWWKKDL